MQLHTIFNTHFGNKIGSRNFQSQVFLLLDVFRYTGGWKYVCICSVTLLYFGMPMNMCFMHMFVCLLQVEKSETFILHITDEGRVKYGSLAFLLLTYSHHYRFIWLRNIGLHESNSRNSGFFDPMHKSTWRNRKILDGTRMTDKRTWVKCSTNGTRTCPSLGRNPQSLFICVWRLYILS